MAAGGGGRDGTVAVDGGGRCGVCNFQWRWTVVVVVVVVVVVGGRCGGQFVGGGRCGGWRWMAMATKRIWGLQIPFSHGGGIVVWWCDTWCGDRGEEEVKS